MRQNGLVGTQADGRQLRCLIRLLAVGMSYIVTHLASVCDAVSGSYSFHRHPLLRSNCSELAESAEAPPSFPHRSPCSRCGAPIPAIPRAHFRRRRTHTCHARERPPRSPLRAGALHYIEMPPDSHGRRFPFPHSRDTCRRATESGIRRISSCVCVSACAPRAENVPTLA